jgi:hypothetical protein
MQATIFMTPDRASGNFARYARFDAPLTDAQLIEMSGQGVAIESHGMTHRYLSDLPEQAISWELEEARRTLAATTGRPIRFFAVPSGDYNRTVRRLTIRAGYEAVYCMRHGSNSRASDLYALRRLTVGKGFGIDDFRRLLTPAAACQLRLVNECHNLLRVTLGPRRLDALHDVLNRTGIRTWLRPGRLRVALILVAAVALLMLSALAFALFRGI